MRHWVGASTQAVLQGDRQQLKALGCEQLGQLVEQLGRGGQLAQPEAALT